MVCSIIIFAEKYSLLPILYVSNVYIGNPTRTRSPTSIERYLQIWPFNLKSSSTYILTVGIHLTIWSPPQHIIHQIPHKSRADRKINGLFTNLHRSLPAQQQFDRKLFDLIVMVRLRTIGSNAKPEPWCVRCPCHVRQSLTLAWMKRKGVKEDICGWSGNSTWAMWMQCELTVKNEWR